jgi:RNA polymerase sigma-70 factor (ECF subfamily)
VIADADLAGRFQAARPHLGAVAFRMLGSVDDAEDAVQEAWLRLGGRDGWDASEIANLDAWLTTVVARICLNTLRSRRARPREELVARVPDPIVDAVGDIDPEHQAMLADAVGLALFVILDTLAPAERLAFVLHDVFAVPFDQIPDRTDRRAVAGSYSQIGQPGAPPHPASRTQPGHRPQSSAHRRRRFLRRRTCRRLRSAGRRP